MWRWWFGIADLSRAVGDTLAEITYSHDAHPGYTNDPVRRVGLICEEVGEAMTEALDWTRPLPNPGVVSKEEYARLVAQQDGARKRLYKELSHCASMALKAMAAMNAERTREER